MTKIDGEETLFSGQLDRMVVYRDRGEFRMTYDTPLDLTRVLDVVASGSPKAMEAVIRLMRTGL